MSVKVDISEMAAYSAKLRHASGTVGARASAVLRKTAYDIEADAKQLIQAYDAVDTGAMLNSVSTTIAGDGRNGVMTAEIGPTVEYAIYVHEGTSRMPGRPFLTDAYDRRIGPFEQVLGRLAEEAL